MSILAFGNEIILASSQKGQPSFIYNYGDTRVLDSLRLCNWSGEILVPVAQPIVHTGPKENVQSR